MYCTYKFTGIKYVPIGESDPVFRIRGRFGSLDPYTGFRIRITDPYSVPDLDPALFVTVFQETNKRSFLPTFLSLLLTGSVADPDPGSGIWCFFDPLIRNPRWKKSGSGIRDEYPGSYFRELGNIVLVKNT
jgi:hypothetical protein